MDLADSVPAIVKPKDRQWAACLFASCATPAQVPEAFLFQFGHHKFQFPRVLAQEALATHPRSLASALLQPGQKREDMRVVTGSLDI